MNPPPFIMVADHGVLKAFAAGGCDRDLRLVNAIDISGSRNRPRDLYAGQIAGHVVNLLKAYQPSRWAFAAPAEINGAVLDRVSPQWLHSLQDNMKRDLHNEGPRALTRLFDRPVA